MMKSLYIKNTENRSFYIKTHRPLWQFKTKIKCYGIIIFFKVLKIQITEASIGATSMHTWLMALCKKRIVCFLANILTIYFSIQ